MCFLNLGVKGLTMAPHTFTVKSLRCRHIGSTKWGGVGWGGVAWGGVAWGGVGWGGVVLYKKHPAHFRFKGYTVLFSFRETSVMCSKDAHVTPPQAGLCCIVAFVVALKFLSFLIFRIDKFRRPDAEFHLE